jgi:hypothetical protein
MVLGVFLRRGVSGCGGVQVGSLSWTDVSWVGLLIGGALAIHIGLRAGLVGTARVLVGSWFAGGGRGSGVGRLIRVGLGVSTLLGPEGTGTFVVSGLLQGTSIVWPGLGRGSGCAG